MSDILNLIKRRDEFDVERRRANEAVMADPIAVFLTKRLSASGTTFWVVEDNLVCSGERYYSGDTDYVTESVPLSVVRQGEAAVREHFAQVDAKKRAAQDAKKKADEESRREYKRRELERLQRELR